jgi:hypothetical protein
LWIVILRVNKAAETVTDGQAFEEFLKLSVVG